jgi:hypothetical protein
MTWPQTHNSNAKTQELKKKKVNAINNSIVTNSNKSKIDEISEKEFKKIILKVTNEINQDTMSA